MWVGAAFGLGFARGAWHAAAPLGAAQKKPAAGDITRSNPVENTFSLLGYLLFTLQKWYSLLYTRAGKDFRLDPLVPNF